MNLCLRSMSEIISLSAVWDGTRLEGCGVQMMTAVNGGLKKYLVWFQFWCGIIPLVCRLYRRDLWSQCIGFRCTPDHMCTHSEGHCKSDSDCERSGYHICGATCIGWVLVNVFIWTFHFQDPPLTQSTIPTTLTSNTLLLICAVFAGDLFPNVHSFDWFIILKFFFFLF